MSSGISFDVRPVGATHLSRSVRPSPIPFKRKSPRTKSSVTCGTLKISLNGEEFVLVLQDEDIFEVASGYAVKLREAVTAGAATMYIDEYGYDVHIARSGEGFQVEVECNGKRVDSFQLQLSDLENAIMELERFLS